MNVCTLLEAKSAIFDIIAGIFFGFYSLAVLLAIIVPAISMSGVPTRLLVDLIYYYLTNLIFRIFILFLSIIAPVLLAALAGTWLNSIVTKLDCFPIFTFGVEMQFAIFLGPLIIFEYWIALLYLDSPFGLAPIEIKRIQPDLTPNLNHPIELLRTAQNVGLLNLELAQDLLENIKFSESTKIEPGRPITYGGLLFQARIVLPTQFQALYPGELMLPVVLNEIAKIRRRDSFFYGVFTAVMVLFKGRLDFRNKDIIYDTFALTSFVPEIVIHTLCSMDGDPRPVQKGTHEFHKQTFDLISKHSDIKSNPTIRARIIWAAQFCKGGGYFKELNRDFRKMRSKLPRMVIGTVCAFSLIIPLYQEIRDSLRYHNFFLAKYPPRGLSPKLEKY